MFLLWELQLLRWQRATMIRVDESVFFQIEMSFFARSTSLSPCAVLLVRRSPHLTAKAFVPVFSLSTPADEEAVEKTRARGPMNESDVTRGGTPSSLLDGLSIVVLTMR
jgi:hypothetical protein